jgi:hypothetical protein
MEGTWLFWLRCEICGAEQEAVVRDAVLHKLSSGGFAPLPCHACGARSAKPAARPWELTMLDRTFLRRLWIAGE